MFKAAEYKLLPIDATGGLWGRAMANTGRPTSDLIMITSNTKIKIVYTKLNHIKICALVNNDRVEDALS